MGFTKAIGVLALSLMSLGSSDEFLYKDTRVCARHKSNFCLSYDSSSTMVVLDKKHRLDFDIETIERVNMQINRIYTYATDPATQTEVKSCLVRRTVEGYGVEGLGLAPCDTDDAELVLAVSEPEESGKSVDQFSLREISYVEGRSTVTSPLCLTMTYENDGALEPITKKKQIKRKAAIVLKECSAEFGYSQDYKARGYEKRQSTRMIAEVAEEVEYQRIGRFCLSAQPDLCLGISLTNGTDLEKNKFVQVKNYTKNEAKNLDDLKMRWFHDVANERIASAAEMDYCMEAIYNAPIGANRPGVEQYDDIVHLGECDPNRQAVTDDGFRGLPSAETFYTKAITTATSSYIEIRTDVPYAARDNTTDESITKCVSVVKCVRHDHESCTKYNSIPVYNPADLEQGSYVRLKDCDSENMVSQRFYYVQDTDITIPPTKFPTPQPTESGAEPTTPPTPFPTVFTEETSAPTTQSTPAPAPTVPPTTGGQGSNTETTVNKTGASMGLKAGLAFVGVLCFAVIVVGVAYYYKHRNDFQELPDEDENFVARV